MKKVHILFLMATALLPFTTWATEQTDNSDAILVDSLATIVEETDAAITVAGTIPDNATDTVSSADISAQLEERAPCCFLVTPDSYRKFSFFKKSPHPCRQALHLHAGPDVGGHSGVRCRMDY